MNPPCDYPFKVGWRCSRDKDHTGPCALWPKWWNLPDRLWVRRLMNKG